MRVKLSLKTFGTLALFGFVTSGIGYCLGTVKRGEPKSSQVGALAEADVFAPALSFSEVQNAKAILEGLAFQYISEIQTRRCLDIQSARNAGSGAEPHLDKAIDELEWGMQEFTGTDEEFKLASDLLNALKKAKLHDRWLQVYLRVLYEHPSASMVGKLAPAALRMASENGRKAEILEAFRHVNGIPLDFQTKKDIQTALVQIHTKHQFAIVGSMR